MDDQHDPADPSNLPPGFWSNWPRAARVNYYTSVLTRPQLVAHIRSFIGSGPDGPRPGAAGRLTTPELAAVAADLGALPRVDPRNTDED